MLKAIQIIETSCSNNPDIIYIILAGNHDVSKNQDIVSSFQVLQKYFNKKSLSNLIIADKYLELKSINDTTIHLYPYNPFIENVVNLNSKIVNSIAIGHWDTKDFSAISGTSKYTSNLLTKEMYSVYDVIITGHEHMPRIEHVDDCILYVTGSMQPYAHGEQLSNEVLYQTLSLEVVEKLLLKDKDCFKNTNLRILVTLKDPLIKDINCLGLSFKYLKEDTKEVSVEKEEDSVENTSNTPLSFNTLLYQYLSLEDSSFNKYIESCFINKQYDDWSFDESN